MGVYAMQKINEMIGSMDYMDLEMVHFDLKTGSKHLKHLVSCEIEKRNSQRAKICASCGVQVLEEKGDEILLTFGPKDLRQKATFCAIDCLTYFINKYSTKK